VAEVVHALRREDLSFVDRAPLRVEHGIDVARSPRELWPALAEATQWPRWFAGMVAARYTSEPPHGVGATRWVDVQGLRVNEEVLVFDEPSCFAFVVLDADRPGIAAMVEVVTLDPRPSGTRVTYRQALELSWWLRPLAPLLRRRLERGLRAGLDGLASWRPQQ
jgi:uncharacterized protein YndB with AHSA1/START domain